MKFSKILLNFSVLLLVVAAEKNEGNDDRGHSLQAKSHRNKIQQEKSHVHNSINRHKKSELRNEKGHNIHHLVYRTGNGDSSEICGNGTKQQGVQVLYNSDAHLIAIVNQSANTALIVDYSSNVIGLLNGQTGESIIIDINSRTIYRISGSQNNSTWVALRSSFEGYFQNLTSLQPLLKLGQQTGEKYNVTDVNQSLINDIFRVLNPLGIPRLSKAFVEFVSHLKFPGTSRLFNNLNASEIISRFLRSNLTELENIIPTLLRGGNPSEMLSNVWTSLTHIPAVSNLLNVSQFLNPTRLRELVKNNSEIISRLLARIPEGANLTEIFSNARLVAFLDGIFGRNISRYLKPNSAIGSFGHRFGVQHGRMDNIVQPILKSTFGVTSGIRHRISSILRQLTGGLGSSNSDPNDVYLSASDRNKKLHSGHKPHQQKELHHQSEEKKQAVHHQNYHQ